MLATHQKLLDHAKQSATGSFKTASKEQFKEQKQQVICGNKIANIITKVSKNSGQNNSDLVTKENNEIPKIIPKINTQRKIFISGKKTRNYWCFKIKTII